VVRKVAENDSKEIKLEFSVEDTGIGIKEDKINDLFQSFSQADSSTTRKYGGTGLGLGICKGFVEKMKGEIWVESKGDEGSTFYFTCVVDKLDEQNNTRLKEAQAPEDSIKKIVEDDEISRKVIEKFARQEGWQVISAENGKEAVDAYRDYSFDAILMDIQMPIFDGYQATGVIRQLE